MKSKILAIFVIACFISLSTFTASAACIKTRIMPLGDSITLGVGEIAFGDDANLVGYRQLLWQDLFNTGYSIDFVGSMNSGYAVPGFDSNHEGHGGWTAGMIAQNIYPWLQTNPPDIIILHIGTNNLWWVNSDQQALIEVENILDEINLYKTIYGRNVTVILAQIINRNQYSSITSSFNNLLRDMVAVRQAAGERIILVDMEHALDYPNDMYDLLHPRSSGYAKMANVWFSVLGEVMSTCTETGNQAPNGVIDSPSGGVTIYAGGSVMFAGTGSDPDGNLPLTYLWQFGAGSGVPDSTLKDPGTVQFNIPGVYMVSFKVMDSLGLSDPTVATRVITVRSSSPVISQTGWSLRYVDSEELVGGNWAAVNAFDGNVNTMWHTQWNGGSPVPPHEIQIDLGMTYNIDGFRYLPRQDSWVNGWIGQYEFYVSTDGLNWGNLVATGIFANSPLEKEVSFATKTGRYIRLRALTEVNGNPWTSVAEINVLGNVSNVNQAPNGVINSPSVDVTIYAGGSVVFGGTGSDPDGNLPLSYLWQFGAGSGVPDSTLKDPGAVQFNVPGTYTVSFTVTDALGLSDPTPATRVITVRSSSPVVPQTGWSLWYVDSEELVGGNWAAVNAFDGNANTIWHTQWNGGSPVPPHEIQIDLGMTYNIDGFRYLPRQDGEINGMIAQYEFYVSTDGLNWGNPVATGIFANSSLEKEVSFATKTGRYIRLRALTEVNGNPWTSMAEINVLGSLSNVNQSPNGVIDGPSGGVTIYAGGSVVFAGTGSDPDGNFPLTYLWHFGVGSGVPDSALEDPGSVQFNVPGTYTVSFTVTDALGLSDPTPAARVITVRSSSPVISQTGWSLLYVDSEELVGGNWAAVNAFDGNVNTMWHTQWNGGSPVPPHEIQIDLGMTYNIDGFRYLPRQDSWVNGWIGQYEFYVSMDGINWGNPVAVGSFIGDKTEKEVSFAPKTGRYIRLRALTEANGNPWTSMAEINVLGN